MVCRITVLDAIATCITITYKLYLALTKWLRLEEMTIGLHRIESRSPLLCFGTFLKHDIMHFFAPAQRESIDAISHRSNHL